MFKKLPLFLNKEFDMLAAEIAQELWVQMGSVGLSIFILIAVVYYMNKHIMKLMKTHKCERDEWRNVTQGHTDRMMDVVESNTAACSELCTLIKAKG